MSDCELLDICKFFNEFLPSMKSVARTLKESYCLGDNSECARFLVYKELGVEAVPKDLFPNDLEKAELIIATH